MVRSLTTIASRALAKSAAGSLAVLDDLLSPNIVTLIADAAELRRAAREAPSLAVREPELSTITRPLHRTWLLNVPRAQEARELLADMLRANPRWAVSPAEVAALLHHLFAVFGSKRQSDEADAKLAACIGIFAPESNTMARALDLWQPAPLHPAVVAIACKQLLATKVFQPSEAELRDALEIVRRKLREQWRGIDDWQAILRAADQIMFRRDPVAWADAYRNVPSAVALAMLDDDWSSPRALALNAIWEAKHEAEEAAEPEPPRAAACAAKPEKRTRK